MTAAINFDYFYISTALVGDQRRAWHAPYKSPITAVPECVVRQTFVDPQRM